MQQPREAIWKFPLRRELGGAIQRIQSPYIIHVLCIQWQGNEPVMWARVMPDAAKRPFVIVSYGTGDIFTTQTSAYLGTVQAPDGDAIHYFSGCDSLFLNNQLD
jgi:hypothetical protein